MPFISVNGLTLNIYRSKLNSLSYKKCDIFIWSSSLIYIYKTRAPYENVTLFIAKRKRRIEERKWRNTKLTIFKDLYRQAKHKVSKLVHSAKCKFYTERIALASSSKELHQIVNIISKRHPPRILPTIYPSADLPSIFIKHFTNKVEKFRANIASEHVTSTLVTGTTVATFYSFEKVSQLTVKECILILLLSHVNLTSFLPNS